MGSFQQSIKHYLRLVAVSQLLKGCKILFLITPTEINHLAMFEVFILFCLAVLVVTGVDKSKISDFKDESTKLN